MTTLDSQRWQALWKDLGATAPTGSFDQLAGAYAQSQRHYHNAGHILACLGHLDRHRVLAAQPALVELALWTHDLVYDTHRQDNEAASADQACAWLEQAGLAKHSAALREMILATTHQEPAAGDAALVVDIDLAILAAPAEIYLDYAAAVRAEFAWVPSPCSARDARACCKACWRCPGFISCRSWPKTGKLPPVPT